MKQRWLLATAVIGLFCLACDGESTPPVSTGNLQDLYSRNLDLPSLAPGADCPISAQQDIGGAGAPTKKSDQVPSYGFGTWPVFLTGGGPWFTEMGALVVINPEYGGPLIVRGRQLDGGSGIPLEAELGSTALGEHGVEFAASSSGKWRKWTGRIAKAASPGCYGLQVDGFTFTSQIVFEIQAGPRPPG